MQNRFYDADDNINLNWKCTRHRMHSDMAAGVSPPTRDF